MDAQGIQEVAINVIFALIVIVLAATLFRDVYKKRKMLKVSRTEEDSMSELLAEELPEDEYIVLPVGKRTEEVNEVISLSETAGFIYIHADQAEDIEELAQLVGNEYGIEASEVYEDVENVVKTLREKGILL